MMPSCCRAGIAIAVAMVTLLAAAGTARADAPAVPNTLARPTTATEQCTNGTCHGNLQGRKYMHGPVAQQKCIACHQYAEPREHRFRLASPQNTLCGDCHTLQHRTVVHAPLKQGLCTGCHDPHGSEHRAMLLADPTRGLCLSCHKQDFEGKKYVHGPVNTGACILCHEPHSAWQPKLLTEAPEKLCAGCHSETIPKGEQARHIHAPVKNGNCTECHDAHASDVRHQLRKPAAELCASCHQEMQQLLAGSKIVHGAVHAAEGCVSCHSPHFSQLPKLQRAAQPQSCLGCHDKPLKTAEGAMLADIASLLKSNPQQHGPIREGACTACHQPHAGEKFRLLAADYPPDFYSDFKLDDYALCFNCHIPDLVLKEQGNGLTRFRDGDTNLHWLHVNRQKGRTCRACHEVHASRNPFHIRDSVPFGDKGWLLEVNYKQSETGGQCAPGCHAPKTYNRADGPAPAPAPAAPKQAQEKDDGIRQSTTLAR